MYRGRQPLDEELQRQHEERNRLLRETLSISEAATKYGLSKSYVARRLMEMDVVPVYDASPRRCSIADIEAALGRK
jgi:AraC-like DNA-binding protein